MTRERLPNRHTTIRRRFDFGGHRYYGDIGFYKDWRPGEVFLDVGKPGTDMQHMARDLAVAVSLGLQHGVTLAELRDAVTRLDDGSPAGPLGKFLDIIAAEWGVAG
jgi:ribonucleoside-diphosphate reductase alpha chain